MPPRRKESSFFTGGAGRKEKHCPATDDYLWTTSSVRVDSLHTPPAFFLKKDMVAEIKKTLLKNPEIRGWRAKKLI